MFVVIYELVAKDGCEIEFKDSWLNVTEEIYRCEGSLGSRLHKSETGKYIAYAQWPDRETWKKSRQEGLSKSYEHAQEKMLASLQSARILFELNLEVDYLQPEQAH